MRTVTGIDVAWRPRSSGRAAVALMVVLALGLCGLCAYQWVRETRLRQRVEALQEEQRRIQEARTAVEAQSGRFQEEIARLERERAALARHSETNAAATAGLRADVVRLGREAETQRQQAQALKAALDTANTNVLKANDLLGKARTDLSQLARERNEAVERANALRKELDDRIVRYNELVERWNKQQEELKRAIK